MYIAPLTKALIASYGVFDTFRILGIVFGLMIMGFAQFLAVPKVTANPTGAAAGASIGAVDYTWREMVRTRQFWMLWLMFLSGSMAGLILIGHLAKIAVLQTGINMGVTLVAMIALSNALGRPVAGFVSDRIGRGKIMTILSILQAMTLFFFSDLNSFASILIGSMIVTFSYGAMLAVYPSAIGDFYGMRNMGFNYAILFTAWGVAGFSGPLAAGYLLDLTGGYQATYLIASILCFFAAVLGAVLKSPAVAVQEQALCFKTATETA